jgi:hypothetical protein
MARIRTIKPEFPQSESIGKVSRDARLLFILIWTIADDAGRTRAAPRMLASLLFPYDDDAAAKIEGWLCELEAVGCVRRYSFEGSAYLDIPQWLKHQKIDKPSPSRLPEFMAWPPTIGPHVPSPDGNSTNPREASRAIVEPSRAFEEAPRTLAPDLGPRTIVPRTEDQENSSLRSLVKIANNDACGEADKLPDQFTRSVPAPEADVPADASSLARFFSEFYDVFPRKAAKKAAARAFLKAVKEGAKPAHLIAMARLFAELKAGTDPQFIPMPATWLNQGRFDDEELKRPPGSGPPKGAARPPSASDYLARMSRELDEEMGIQNDQCSHNADGFGGLTIEHSP